MRAVVAIVGVVCAFRATGAEFEVATVRQSPPPAGDTININIGTARNGKLTFENASLSDCLRFAYNLASDDQLAGPDWIKSKEARFDIVAQAPAGAAREQLPAMLQALLAERLSVSVHHEKKVLLHLALLPGKGELKMRRSETPVAPPSAGPALPGRIVRPAMSMQLLATLLSRFERQAVIDESGLDGDYDVQLEWAPTRMDASVSTPADAPTGPSIFTAVEQQLGLKLESRKGPIDVLVVDHADRVPRDN